jgi:hypothetical protein
MKVNLIFFLLISLLILLIKNKGYKLSSDPKIALLQYKKLSSKYNKIYITGNDHDRIRSFLSKEEKKYENYFIINCGRRNKILEYNKNYVKVESGVTFIQLNRFLMKKNRSIEYIPNYGHITLGATAQIGVHGCVGGVLIGNKIFKDILVIDRKTKKLRYLEEKELLTNANVIVLEMKVKHVKLKKSVVKINVLTEDKIKIPSLPIKNNKIYWCLWILKKKKILMHKGYECDVKKNNLKKDIPSIWPLTFNDFYFQKMKTKKKWTFFPNSDFHQPLIRNLILKLVLPFHNFYSYKNFACHIPPEDLQNCMSHLKKYRESVSHVQIRIINKVLSLDVTFEKNEKNVIKYFVDKKYKFHQGKLEG